MYDWRGKNVCIYKEQCTAVAFEACEGLLTGMKYQPKETDVFLGFGPG